MRKGFIQVVTVTPRVTSAQALQTLDCILRHVINLDGNTLYSKDIAVPTPYEDPAIILPQFAEPPIFFVVSEEGIHTFQYLNSDTRPWHSMILIALVKSDGTITNSRMIALGASPLTGTTHIGRSNVTIQKSTFGQKFWQPGNLITGSVEMLNDGEADTSIRLKARILGTNISATTGWVPIKVGQTVTVDLSTLRLTVPHWTEISWDEIFARAVEYMPCAFLELTIETLEAIGYTHCTYIQQLYYTSQSTIEIWSPSSEGTVPATVPVIFDVYYTEYNTLGGIIGAGSIANVPLDAYVNDEYLPPPTGVERKTDENGRYIQYITFTIAGAYVVTGYFKGDQNYPPAAIWRCLLFIAKPKTGTVAEITSHTLPCGQKLDPGTRIAGEVTIQNTGDAAGYCALYIATYEYATGKTRETITSPVWLNPNDSTKIDITQYNIVMPSKDALDILLAPGRVTDPTNPAGTFSGTGSGIICTIYPTLGAKGHLESYSLPSSLQTGQPITGTITVKNVGGMRGKIALKVTTLWDNKLVFANYMELDPSITWTVDVSQLGIYMPNQNATIHMEVGHLEDGMETFVLDESPTEHTITLTAPPPPGNATLYGYVKDAWTTNPIPNAKVTLNGTSTTTDPTGWFSLTVPAKTEPYTLTVTATGYSPYTESITLSEAKSYRKDVNLTPTTALLKGTARNIRTGAGVPDVTITLNTKYSAKTDSYGRYQIEKITVPATLTLTATRTGFQTFTYTLNFPTADIYTFDFDMTPTPPPPVEYATLKGTVRSPFGMVSGATITLNGIETASNPDGTYTIEGITLGTYTLTVKPPLPLNLICKADVETLDLTEAKEYTKDIYLPLNIINISGVAAGIGLLATLFIYAVRE
jgi:hypothetical protein